MCRGCGGVPSMGDDRPGDEPCPAAALRVVAAAAWHVVRARRFSEFPWVLSFLETVAAAAPELVPFQHLVKLRLGLQAKIVMTMLQEDEPNGKIYDVLGIYFPMNEAPLHHSRATPQDLELIQKAQENFRILVLRFLSDTMEKEAYMQFYLEADYGEEFVSELEMLFCDYLCELEYVLPEPQFQTLLEAAGIPNQLPHPSATILNQYLSAVGYQWADGAELPASSPHSSCTPRQNEDEDSRTPSLSPQSGRSQREDSPSCTSEGDAHNHSWETTEEIVPDSESERSTSPYQDEYQDTHLCTLVPTLQKHLRDSGSHADTNMERSLNEVKNYLSF